MSETDFKTVAVTNLHAPSPFKTHSQIESVSKTPTAWFVDGEATGPSTIAVHMGLETSSTT